MGVTDPPTLRLEAAVKGHIDFQGSFHGPRECTRHSFVVTPQLRSSSPAARYFRESRTQYQCSIIPRVHSIPETVHTPWHHQERLIGLISQGTGHIAFSVGTEAFTSNVRHSSASLRAERDCQSVDLRRFHLDWSFEVSAGPFGHHHLGSLAPKTAHWAQQHSTSHPWTILSLWSQKRRVSQLTTAEPLSVFPRGDEI